MTPRQVRSTHPCCFRSGQWATIVRHDVRQQDHRPTWLVSFPDGVTDVWVADDDHARYQFRNAS